MNGPSRWDRWSVSARVGLYTGPREPNGCRLWTGLAKRHARWNYAVLRVDGRQVRVSRILTGLTEADPRVAMHTCDQPLCVEPSHIRVGTQSENMLDMAAKGRNWNAVGSQCPRCGSQLVVVPRAGSSTRHDKRCRPCAARRTAEWKRRLRSRSEMHRSLLPPTETP